MHFDDVTRFDAAFLKSARLAFMRIHPVLATLDIDHDGQISMSEIERAPAELVVLDIDGDGMLTDIEVRPIPSPKGPTLVKTK